MNLKINILGTMYTVIMSNEQKDPKLLNCDGYCDKTSKKIVVLETSAQSDLDNYECYRKKVLRHEITHAFLFESGLHENFEHKTFGHDETMVDWIAVQFPKLLEVFKKADCL